MPKLLPTSLLVLAAAALAVPTSTAEAQCSPDAVFCADIQIGGSISIGHAPPPPPRSQVVVVQPAPPPPPPVVVYTPAPEPPPPQTTVVVTQPAPQPEPVYYAPPPPERGPIHWGVHGHIGGLLADNVQMGGLTGALRLRPNDGHVAVDFGLGTYGGTDYNGLDRVEVPLTADLYLFANPDDRLQVYGVGGLGISVAHAEGFHEGFGDWVERDYAHFGAQLGAGLELRLGRHFALNGDLRGFLRERIDDDPEPEFVDLENGRTTDTSGGAVLNLGATLYF